MDGSVYPDEVHDFDEALLVIDGQMNLDIAGAITAVRAGEVFYCSSGDCAWCIDGKSRHPSHY